MTQSDIPVHSNNGNSHEAVSVLLVEDNAVNQLVARETLTRLHGLHCDVADNGRAALAQLRDASSAYHLVIMDCQMPVMDGYEASRRIRAGEAGAAHKDVPIIAMTANTGPDDRATCLAAGMNDYLAKPLDNDALSASLEQWLGRETSRYAKPTDIEDPAIRAAGIQWPDPLDCFDRDRADAGSARQATTYLQALRLFIQRYEELPEGITTLPENTLLDTVHGLKGVAGNLAIPALERSTRALEQARLDKGMTLSSMREDLRITLRNAIAEARSILAINTDDQADTPIRPFDEILGQLHPMLERGEWIPPETLGALRSAIEAEGNQPHQNALLDSIERFDYESALQEIDAISFRH